MKKTARILCALLAAVLLLSTCSFSLAEEAVTVFIPSQVARLDLPESGSTYEGDPFQTGYEGAKAYIDRETVTIYSTCEDDKTGKIYKNWDDVTYVASVTVTYPAGNYIRKVVAKYRNDKKNTLAGYTITYETAPGETYTVTYAPKTSTVTEDHFAGNITYYSSGIHSFYNMDTGELFTVDASVDQASRTVFTDSYGGVYIHHYTKDQILEGVYRCGGEVLHSGGGKQIKNWFTEPDWAGRSKKSGKRGLIPVTSFVSPRVE